MNVPPLQSLLDHPDYQTLDPDKKVEAIRNWEQDEIKRRNQSGDWDIESRALFEVQTRQARQAALGIEPQSPEAILQGVAEDEADPEDVRIWDSLAEVQEAERQQREINRRRVIPWLREENDAELLATAEGKIEAVKSREGDLDIEMARLGAEALQGKRDAAVVRGKLVVNPELYYDRERFVSVVNASAATDREKARVLSGFYRGREETAKAALPRLEGVGAFRDFARAYVQENPDVTNGDVVEAFRKSDAGEFDKWYEAISTGFLSAMEGVGYLGFAAAELPKLVGRAANAVGLESFGAANTAAAEMTQSAMLSALGETGAAKAQSAEKVAALGGYSAAQEYGQVGGQVFGELMLMMLSGGTSILGAGIRGATKQATKQAVASEVGKRLGVGGLAKKWTLERAKILVSPVGIIAGASSGGPALYEAYERNRKKLASEGLVGPELEEQARGAAFLDASRSAVITATVTSLFGLRGTEGVARLTQAAGSQAARQAIAKTAKERWVSAGFGALSEGVEEAIDEGVNGGLDALLENPDMTFEDWQKATLFAGSAGLLFGGATEAFVNLAEARAERIRNSPEMAARQQQVSDLRASGLNQTADALEADNAAVEAQAVSDAIDDIEARAAGAINRLDEIDTEVSTLSRTPGNEARIEELVAEREQLNEILAAGQQNLRNYDPVATANVAVADVVAEGIEPEEARRRVTEVINTRHRGVPVAPETLVSEALAMETPTTTPTTDEEGIPQTTQAETVTPGQTSEVTRPTRHRVFEGGSPIPVKPGPGVLTAVDETMAFRITGQPQIDDIIQSGEVRAKEGKMRGGRSGETQWSRGHSSLGYKSAQNSGRYVIVAPAENLDDRKGGLPISEVSKIYRADGDTWTDVTEEIKSSSALKAAPQNTTGLREIKRAEGEGFTAVQYEFTGGSVSVRIRNDGTAFVGDVQIGEASDQTRGKGLGTKVYQELGDSLLAQGVTLESTRWSKDRNAISPAALRVWEKLMEQGLARVTGTEIGKVADRFTGEESVREYNTYEYVGKTLPAPVSPAEVPVGGTVDAAQPASAIPAGEPAAEVTPTLPTEPVDAGALPQSENPLSEGAAGTAPISFTTEKGSTYELHEDGTTTRTKAERAEQPGDFGLKPRSSKTVYVSPDLAREIGMWQTSNATGKRILLRDGVVTLLSDNAGKKGRDSTISPAEFSETPAVGLSPLELWEPDSNGFFRGNHPGNPIVSLNRPAPTPARGTDETGTPAGGRAEETAPLPPAEPAVAETGVTELPVVSQEPGVGEQQTDLTVTNETQPPTPVDAGVVPRSEKPLSDDAAEAIRDIIDMRKSQGQSIDPNMVARLARYDAAKQGVEIPDGGVVSQIVVGHPLFEAPHAELNNLLPLQAFSYAELDRKWGIANRLREETQTFVAKGNLAHNKAKTPSQKKKAEKDFPRSEITRKQEVLDYMANDTFPEFDRMFRLLPAPQNEGIPNDQGGTASSDTGPNTMAPNILSGTPATPGVLPGTETEVSRISEETGAGRENPPSGTGIQLADDVVDTAWAATEGNPEARAELEAVMTPEQRARFEPVVPDNIEGRAVTVSPDGRIRVQSEENRQRAARGERQIGGDRIFDTREEAEIETRREIEIDRLNAEFWARQDAETAAREAAEQAKAAPLNEYLDDAGFKGVSRGRVKSTLSAPKNLRNSETGKVYNDTRFNVIHAVIKDGGRVEAKSGKRAEFRLYSDQDTFWDINKTEYDAGLWVMAKNGPATAVDDFAPDAVPLDASPTGEDFTLDSDWQDMTNVLLDRAIAKYPKIPVTKDSTIPAPARTMGLRILVNPEELARYTNGMEPEDAAEMIEKIFIHEAAHRHAVAEVGADFVNDYAARMTVDERVDVAMQYLHPSAYPTTEAYLAAVNDFAAVDPALPEGERRLRYFRLGHEALRMNVERFRTGFTTEETLAFLQTNPGNLARFVRYLRSYLNRLGEWFRLRKDPALGVEVKRLSKVLDTLTKGETIPRGPAPFDPNAKGRREVVGLDTGPVKMNLYRLSDGRSDWIADGDPVPSGSTLVRSETRTEPGSVDDSNLFTRHAELEAKNEAGTITPEEIKEAEKIVEQAVREAGMVRFSKRAVRPEDIQERSETRKRWSDKARQMLGIRVHPSEIPVISDRFFKPADFPEALRDLLDIVQGSKRLSEEQDIWGNDILELATTPMEPGRSLDAGLRNKVRSELQRRNAAIERIRLRTNGLYSDSEILSLASDLPTLVEIESEDRFSVLGYKTDTPFVSAEPFTGVPLSQRFNPESDSILETARVGIWNRPKPEGYVKGGINTAAHKWDRRIYKMLEDARGIPAKYMKRGEMLVRDINVLSKEFNVSPEQIDAALGSTDDRLAAADVEQIKQIKKRGLAAAQGVYMSARNLAKQYDSVQDFAQAALVRQEAKKQFDLNVQTYKKAAENYEARARKRIADEARVARHAALDALPKPMADKVAEMRATIDQLSARLIAEGGLSSEIQATISNNLELWLHRSYQIFDDPNYAEWLREQKDPEAIKLRNQTVNFIRQDLEARKTAELVAQGMTQTAAKAQAKIEVTDLHVQQTFDDYLMVADKGSKTLLTGATVSKEVSALMKRGVIPEEIQKLWGRYDDPKVNLAKSIGAIAQHLAIHKFYEDVVALGTREGWLVKDEPGVIKYDPQGNRLVELLPNNGMTGRYGGTPDARYAPLAGYLGPKDLRDALAQTIEDSVGNFIMRFFQQLTGYSMASKTVLSWQSGMRNYSGGALPTFLNGNLNLFTKEGREAFARGHALAWGNLWNKADNKIDRAYLERLAELGVTGDGVTYNLVRDLTGGFDSNSKAIGLMGVLSRKLVFPHVLVKGAKKGYDMAGKGYNFPDEIWKVINFEMEKSRLKEILPGESADVIERRAADIVRNTVPTYSRAPEWVKVVRKFPFIAPFITFPVEMMRVTIGQVKVGLDFIAEGKESGNAAMTKAGYHRLLTLGANAAVIGSLPIIARTLFGFSKDDEDDLRKHLAPWEQNVTLLLLDSADPAEAINYLNVSYMNPYDVWLRPVRAAQRGFRDPNTSVYENLRNAAAEFFDPIAKEQILFGSIIDTRRGVTASGTRVWDKTDSDEVKFGKSIRHIYNSALEPGTITSAERIWKGLTGQVTGSGRAYSGWQEGMSAVFGMKAQSVDVSSTLGYAAKDFQGARLDATAAFNRVFKSRGTQKDEVIIANYQSANEKLRDTYRVLYEKTVAAVRLGTMTRAEAMKLLRAEGLTAEAIGDIFNNRFRRYTPSRESLNEARDRGAALNQDRIGLYRQALETVPPVQPISEDDFF